MRSRTGPSTSPTRTRAASAALGAFNYSPPIARLFDPFGLLEWPSFLWIWLALLVANLVWLGGRGVRVLWLLALPPVAFELYHGNVHLWIASAIVLGFRYPWTWAFVLLTKVTPGLGLVWFAARREWRSLAIALGVTAAIVAVSLAHRPPALVRVDLVPLGDARRRVGGPVPDRRCRSGCACPSRSCVVVWGALTDRRWTVPLAATLALPVLWISGFAICAACLPLARRTWTDGPAPLSISAIPADPRAA